MAFVAGGTLFGLLAGALVPKILGCYALIPICIRYLRYRFKQEKSDTAHEQSVSRRLPSICAIGALIAVLGEPEMLPFILLPVLLLVIGVGHFGNKGQRVHMALILAIQWFATYILVVVPSAIAP